MFDEQIIVNPDIGEYDIKFTYDTENNPPLRSIGDCSTPLPTPPSSNFTSLIDLTNIGNSQQQTKKFKLDTSNVTPSLHFVKVEPDDDDIDDEDLALHAIETGSKHNTKAVNETKVVAAKTSTSNKTAIKQVPKVKPKPTPNTNVSNSKKQ